MAATSSPRATEAAVAFLRDGANAVDAAVAAAAVLAVVEPQATGIGGDCFMLIHLAGEGRTLGLNASGRAGSAASVAELKRRGHAFMPLRGPLAITVPGALDGWCAALERAGSLPLDAVLAPAVRAAREGFEVTRVVAREWELAVECGMLAAPEIREAWTLDGHAPRAGERFRQPRLADTLDTIGAGGRAAFYEGEFAGRLVDFLAGQGGLLTREDLAAQRAEWVEPIRVGYRGFDVLELPPNGQGLAALIALGILEGFDVSAHPIDSPAALHLLIESLKLAYADRGAYIADPDFADVPVAELLSPAYLSARAGLLRPDRAMALASPGVPPRGTDTVFLATADAAGNLVALINSLYFPFGSGLVVPGTGVTLHNRGGGFTLDEAHPNALAPRKRPFHTLVPAMLARGGAPRAAFGVMGADIQAQAHVQVVSHLVDRGLDPQAALDAPRFFFLAANRVALEEPVFTAAAEALRGLGHDVAGPSELPFPLSFGAGQMIMRDEVDGDWMGASDRRKDGYAAGG
ncbi:MAG: gamma-glutamyltransferase [Deltaproteobacteria bacterium]|nr:gamma-glutamyltransferase [Deltaproteobacteria bacterium]